MALPDWALWSLRELDRLATEQGAQWKQAVKVHGAKAYPAPHRQHPEPASMPASLLPWILSSMDLDPNQQVRQIVMRISGLGLSAGKLQAAADFTAIIRLLIEGLDCQEIYWGVRSKVDLNKFLHLRKLDSTKGIRGNRSRDFDPGLDLAIRGFGSGAFWRPMAADLDESGGDHMVAAMMGAIRGAWLGVQAIPARYSTYLLGVDGEGHVDEVQAAVLRLVGQSPARMARPLPATEPVRVGGQYPIYASDWMGAAGTPNNWAVLSLCRTGREMLSHPVRRQFYLVDQAGVDANLELEMLLEDAIGTIDNWLGEDAQRPIVVHCHAGQSRTAFVLRGWAIATARCREEEARAWLEEIWPRATSTNTSFESLLKHRGFRWRSGSDPDDFGNYCAGARPGHVWTPEDAEHRKFQWGPAK
ncbi:MAG: hypothetical protein NT160_05745 [Actinobacteria bacterium]|nr:hypothetical protein [Actinomycetota bacterium]